MTKFVEIRGGGEFAEEPLLAILYLKDDRLFIRGPEAIGLQKLLQDGIYLKDGRHTDAREIFENLFLYFKSAYLYATRIKEELQLPLSEYEEIEIKVTE